MTLKETVGTIINDIRIEDDYLIVAVGGAGGIAVKTGRKYEDLMANVQRLLSENRVYELIALANIVGRANSLDDIKRLANAKGDIRDYDWTQSDPALIVKRRR